MRTCEELLGVMRDELPHIQDKFSVRKLGVFGSFTRNEADDGSDVDVLVEFGKPTFDNFMDLAFFLEDLIGREVDLVTTGALDQYTRPVVENEVVWC
jgi:predicted nucleotidyltransferase